MNPDLFRITGRGGGDSPSPPVRAGAIGSKMRSAAEKQLELDEEGRIAEANGIHFISFPIVDRGVPTSVPSTVSTLRSVNRALEKGENVAVHCRQGIGRAALFAAGALVVAGKSPEAALEAVRSARGLNVPETQEQRVWLQRDLADSLAIVHR
jgi:protein-tyrosine phosphatase